jgi:hypothetical protein
MGALPPTKTEPIDTGTVVCLGFGVGSIKICIYSNALIFVTTYAIPAGIAEMTIRFYNACPIAHTPGVNTNPTE